LGRAAGRSLTDLPCLQRMRLLRWSLQSECRQANIAKGFFASVGIDVIAVGHDNNSGTRTQGNDDV